MALSSVSATGIRSDPFRRDAAAPFQNRGTRDLVPPAAVHILRLPPKQPRNAGGPRPAPLPSAHPTQNFTQFKIAIARGWAIKSELPGLGRDIAMAAHSRLLSVGILLVAGLTSLPLQLAVAQSAASSQPATSLMASGDSSVRLLANIAVILTCTLIIVGGLFVFFRRGYASQKPGGRFLCRPSAPFSFFRR
jgi:hypothetical protein